MGNYDAAKREYEIVLEHQSSIIPAKDSVPKLGLKIGEHHINKAVTAESGILNQCAVNVPQSLRTHEFLEVFEGTSGTFRASVCCG